MGKSATHYKLDENRRYIKMELKDKIQHERPSSDELSWTQLVNIERQRRSILFRGELPFWRVLLFWKGTCLREIILSPFVWAVVTTYVIIRIGIRSGNITTADDTIDSMDKTNLDILGGFLSFFLVLFVNQTQTRFQTMYGFSKACSGRIQDLAGYARAQLPADDAAGIVRHFNAAHIAGYVGLKGVGIPTPYSRAHFFAHYNKNNQILTPDEEQLMDRYGMEKGGAVMKELVTWCQEDIANLKNAGYIDSYEAEKYHACILQFRASMDGIYDLTDQPPHFFYIHFLALLSFLYLPMFSIHTAYSTPYDQGNLVFDILNGAIVILQCFFVLGLRSLGTKMIDPYGDDLEDLSVIHYCDSTLETCNLILKSKQVGSTNRKSLYIRSYNPTAMDKERFSSILEEPVQSKSGDVNGNAGDWA